MDSILIWVGEAVGQFTALLDLGGRQFPRIQGRLGSDELFE